ncbi:hypothetical protein A3F37_02225 [Candidatus Saccharibacteria bacterium RIFCSPHIGHO2_12_FULL_41_12]|nr:MAG: hypothetical protein A3F37_02225 [Candidatus Saccharibacteria bacterium RIFCSPHIGHO2_12_FULL_41_12]
MVGFVATVLTILAFLPQTFKVVKTRETRDIALLTYLTLVVTSTLWTTYGVLLNNPALYVTNSAVGLCSITIVIFKLREIKK